MLDAMRDYTLPAHGVRDLRHKVARHLEELAREAVDNDNIDLGLAARIADALLSLIDAVADREESAKAAVRGAVDYFVLNRDESPDLDSPDGFHDDARIVNDVCALVGLPELAVQIG